VSDKLLLSQRTFLATYKLNEKMFAHFSVHVFNELDDYVGVPRQFLQLMHMEVAKKDGAAQCATK
jgi:hypothetical protein